MSGPSLASRIQKRLGHLYGLEAPSVDDFVQLAESGREVVYVRESEQTLEIAVHLPRRLVESREVTLDELCQVAEGVSHFLYITERARRRLPTTQLELELQAEVDKFVLLSDVVPLARGAFDARRAAGVRARLFEQVSYLHDGDSEQGERYRVASSVAARFSEKIERLRTAGGAVVRCLRDFYGAGQREKLEMALAA